MYIKPFARADSRPSPKTFSVGEMIVDFGQVFEILKIEQRKTTDGGQETVIVFKPYYQTEQSHNMVSLIPIKSIPLTQIRRPLPKKDFEAVWGLLTAQTENGEPINTSQIKNDLMQNEPEATAKALRSLWLDKCDETTGFASVKQALFEQALKQLTEETAYVFGLSPEEAKKKIEKALQNGKE